MIELTDDVFTASDISRAIGLGVSTVVRHLHKLGYHSTTGVGYRFSESEFQDLIMRIQNRMGQGKRNDL